MDGRGRPWWQLLPIAVIVAVVIVGVALMMTNRTQPAETVIDPDLTATDEAQQDPGETETETETDTGPSELDVVVVAEYPHDSTYTQGLEFIDEGPDAGRLVESGGQWGESLLRIWDPVSGEVVRTHDVDPDLFAEGATVVGDQVWQLTWQAGTAFRYDLATLTPQAEVSYSGEGWGLCQLGTDLVMSDGSATLTFRDHDTFEAMSTVDVTRGGTPVENLNELECVTSGGTDLVWANVYQTTELLAIKPQTGEVVHTVDASQLVPADLVGNSDLVLNGIAYQADTDRFWLTGKRWPVLYEVELR